MSETRKSTKHGATRFLDRLNSLSLSKKLTGFAALAGIPILVFGGIVVKDRFEKIRFVEREASGLAYLAEVWPVLLEAMTEHTSGINKNSAERFKAASAHYDQQLQTGESAKLLLTALQGDHEGRITAAMQHMQRVADHSNLTLDYELDGIYLILAGFVELPKAVDATHRVFEAIQNLENRKELDFDTKSELLLAKHDIQVATGAVVQNILFALQNARQPDIKSRLEPKIKAYQGKVAELDQLVTKTLNRQSAFFPLEDKPSQLKDSVVAVAKAANELWLGSRAELEMMMQERASSLRSGLLASVGLAILLLGLAALTLLRIASSIKKPVAMLISHMDQLRSGQTNFATPYIDLSNEIGDIARALEASRLNATELGRARAEIDSKLGEETSRSADTSRFLVDISKVVRAAGEGQFDQRLQEGDRQGFLYEISRNLNHLLSIVESGIGDTGKMVRSLANGDVSTRMEGSYKGIFAQLMGDVNQLGDQLRVIASRIGHATGAVQVATKEISTGVVDLSGRTEQQASSLEETAASMEELAATVRQNADNAQEANQLAAAARHLAVNGGDIAGRAVNAMDKIEKSSREVSEIVGLIQEIAFQTNILALNAAVEAARAGEAGRGFAVVANEVRALAQRSAQASKDIKELIASTDDTVSEGVGLVKQAGSSLTEITTSVRKVADIVSEIAAASTEQSSGIDQVSQAITNMDVLTQQNALLVEETNAALRSAQQQVEELRQAVAFFSTGNQQLVQAPVELPTLPMLRSPAVEASVEPASLHEKLRQLASKMAATKSAKALHPQPVKATVNSDWKEF